MIYNINMPTGDFGLEASIDLHQCDPQKMNLESLLAFVREMIEIADMTAHGEPVVWDATESDELHIKGFSILQLIKTSSIVVHTMDKTNLICVNLFSCKPFDPMVIFNFAKAFFNTESASVSTTTRGLASMPHREKDFDN